MSSEHVSPAGTSLPVCRYTVQMAVLLVSHTKKFSCLPYDELVAVMTVSPSSVHPVNVAVALKVSWLYECPVLGAMFR